MTDKQINKFSDLTFTQLLGYDLVATFNNNRKIKELQEQLKAKEQECERYAKINEQETKDYADLLKQLDQLKQTLTEIKEIAEDFGFNGIYEDCFTGIQQILQICDEVNECENQ